MPDPEAARKYLQTALSGAAGGLRAASERLGRNHAYLQQYIRRGKPRWLPERVREGLVAFYGVDGTKLKPPPAASTPVTSSDRQDKFQVNVQFHSQLVDDPGKLELLDVWERISERRRPVAMTMLRALADETDDSSAVIAQ